MIAEDDDAMRSMLACTLERNGVAVDTVATGAALLERLSADRRCGSLPDLIVTDVVMPGINGLDTLVAIRRSSSRVPVVLITAFGSRRTHERAIELGARAVFDKPFDLRRFNRYVNQLLAGAPAAAPRTPHPTPRTPRRRNFLPKHTLPITLGGDAEQAELMPPSKVVERLRRALGGVPLDYVPGKTAIRDAAMDELGLSAEAAEELVDGLEAGGYLQFTGSRTTLDRHRHGWRLIARPGDRGDGGDER